MKPLFQLSTRRYSEELVLVKKAMDDLESNCKVKDGFQIKEPFEKAGWTFFNLELSAEMASVIEIRKIESKIHELKTKLQESDLAFGQV